MYRLKTEFGVKRTDGGSRFCEYNLEPKSFSLNMG